MTTDSSRGWTPDRLDSLDGTTHVITGATSGTGHQATRTLLSKGATVVMLNRDVERSTATVAAMKEEFGSEADIAFIHLDLAELGSVRRAAAEVLAEAPRIDSLICNAAIAQVPTQQLTVDGFESQFGVNHLAHFLLCGLLFERVEASAGRVIVVGSNGYKMGRKQIQFDDLNFDASYSGWNAYAHSKLAQMMFAYELQRRCAATGSAAEVQVCHPGMSRTELIDDQTSRLNRVLFTLMKPFAQSAEQGAWPAVMCATEGGLRSATYYGPTKRMDTVGPIGVCELDDLVLDPNAAAQLWATSEELTGLSWSP